MHDLPGTVFLWVAMCFNVQCTDATLYQYESYRGAEIPLCEKDRREMKAALTKAGKRNVKITCKTVENFDKEGFR